MRPVRDVSGSEEPEIPGTIILRAFQIVGYDPDCDGSARARLRAIDKNGDFTDWNPIQLGLYPDCYLVVSLQELQKLFLEK